MAIPGVVTVRTYNIRVAALNDVGPSENAELDIGTYMWVCTYVHTYEPLCVPACVHIICVH